MKPEEFRIGREFQCGEGTFRCTDVGTRTIVAIRVDTVEKTTSAKSETSTTRLTREEAQAEGWFAGPPYAVPEIVFDEDDFEGCERV